MGGRTITLLTPCPLESQDNVSVCEPITSTLYLDLALLTLTIHPVELKESIGITILIDSMQAISSAAEFVDLPRQMEFALNVTDKRRGVLLQYIDAADGIKKHVCFLEESERMKGRCIQELRVIWLERR